ncbi:hypothetical protein W02_04390 [Nitrospira sp. KM1]|uniref:hypothetical protein n=1 Tax=Nitrospira sp. KM1 TaxID=1936990 RepID=UPI0013A79B19|nr:hypothetical protein [Nitrospira sp. KM1]BCA53299.1 hypothetical protein W02_04390 [Nitrospira sp. KM1]
MPVNMDPAKKRRRGQPDRLDSGSGDETAPNHQKKNDTFGEETEEDRFKALADAEKKNLWDATEVIDMDTF